MIKAFFACAVAGAFGAAGVLNEPKLNMPKDVKVLDSCKAVLPNSGAVAEFKLEDRKYYIAPDQRVFVVDVSGAGIESKTETLVGRDRDMKDAVQSLCDTARKKGLEL